MNRVEGLGGDGTELPRCQESTELGEDPVSAMLSKEVARLQKEMQRIKKQENIPGKFVSYQLPT